MNNNDKNCGAATNSGDYGAATNSGDYGAATNSGNYGAATNSGNYGAATNSGNYGAAVSLSTMSHVRSSGDQSSIIGTYLDGGGRRRHLVGYVGENVLAGVWYQATIDGWVAYPEILEFDTRRGYTLTYVSGRYIAGCRNFDAAEALKHWSNPDHGAPESAAILLAAVVANETAIKNAEGPLL